MEALRVSGAISGIDTEGLVSQLMALERRPLMIMRQRLAVLEQKRQAWQTLNTKLHDLQLKLAAVADEATYAKVSAATTNQQVAVATGSDALVGTYALNVTSLAKAHSVGSAEHGSATDALGLSGSPVICGQQVDITAADSLADIAAKVNAVPDIGVRASIIEVAPGAHRLVLVSKTTGAAGAVSLADDGGVLLATGLVDEGGGANTIQAGQDASLTINGLAVTRSTNTISDALPGLTLSLTGEGTATITVSQNIASMVAAVEGFVQSYNAVVDWISAQLRYDPQGSAAKPPLYGESSLSRLRSSLRSLATNPVAGLPEEMRSLWQIGISTGAVGSATAREGKLVLDAAKLRAALETDLDGVRRLLGAGEHNVALASAGAGVVASSEYDPVLFAASAVIDGRIDSDRWGLEGGGWQDGTPGMFPDWLEISFAGGQTIDRLALYTLNSASYPADTYGVKDYTIEYWSGEQWLELLSASGNCAGVAVHTFAPVTTDKIRLQVTASNGAGDHTRLLEVSVFERNNGVASRLTGLCKQYTTSGSGLVATAESSLERQVRGLNSQIESAERRLEMREASLYRRFVAMEKALARLQSQSAWLTAQINSQYSLRPSQR